MLYRSAGLCSFSRVERYFRKEMASKSEWLFRCNHSALVDARFALAPNFWKKNERQHIRVLLSSNLRNVVFRRRLRSRKKLSDTFQVYSFFLRCCSLSQKVGKKRTLVFVDLFPQFTDRAFLCTQLCISVSASLLCLIYLSVHVYLSLHPGLSMIFSLSIPICLSLSLTFIVYKQLAERMLLCGPMSSAMHVGIPCVMSFFVFF